jgi:hypothetical protein
MRKLTKRTRLIFRWIYVAVYLTIISANLYHADWNGAESIFRPKIILQMITVVYIALTIPRDMLLGKFKPRILAKWRRQTVTKPRHCEERQ